MLTVRRFTGIRIFGVVWTLVAVGAAGIVAADAIAPLAAYGAPTQRLAAVAGGWLGGIAFVRLRDRRHWRRMAGQARFERQPSAGGRYPSLQGRVGGRTVTVTAESPRRLSRIHTRVETSVDGVERRVAVRIRYVGSDGVEEGIRTGNPALDDSFVVETDTPGALKPVLTPDVQSTIMDLDTPGVLVVSERRVVYDVPFARLRGPELRRCANAVATVSNRLEELTP